MTRKNNRTSYHYRGVEIKRFHDSFQYYCEGFIPETGSVCSNYRYASFELRGVPKAIDEVLASGNYEITLHGNLRMTEEYRKRAEEGWLSRRTEGLAKVDRDIAEALRERNYQRVASLAEWATKELQILQRFEEEKVSA